MSYSPSPPPQDLALLTEYVHRELTRIAEAFEVGEFRAIRLQELSVALSKPRDGDVVYADGASWNPGAGEGMYCREGGAWSKK